MGAVNFLSSLAVSLFVAPTPGLLAILYVNGGTEIPPLQGAAVMAVSAIGYWAWLLNRRNRRMLERAAEHVRTVPVDRPDALELGTPVRPGNPARVAQATRSRSAEDRRRAEAALRGHDDIPDPLAEMARRSPSEVLIDRVADLRQLKTLVADHEVGLLNAFYRTVARDEFGAPDYANWAYEADRFLLSSSFMARTLNRHEAIATVTAEVEFLAGRVRGEQRTRRAGELLPPPARRATLALPGYPGGQPAAEPMLLPEPVGAPEARRPVLPRRAPGIAETCAAALARHGWASQATDSPGTDAIDLFAERGELAIGLRCRNPGEPVSEDAVQQVVAARDRFGLDAVGIVSRAGFAKPVRALATVNGVFLLEEEELDDLHLYVGQRRKVVPLFRKATAQG